MDLVDQLSDLRVVYVEGLDVVEDGLFEGLSGSILHFVSQGELLVLSLVLEEFGLLSDLFDFQSEVGDLVL